MSSKRLSSIAKLVNGRKLLDIGCDHGYLAMQLFEQNKIDKAILADINEKPLKSAKKNLRFYGDKCEFVLSNGLEKIENNFDTLTISGMGGKLISEIIKNGQNKITTQTIILQANLGNSILRRNLIEMGFGIDKEILIKDSGIIYNIIVASRGNSNYNEEEIEFGRYENQELFCEKLKDMCQHFEGINKNIPEKSQKHNEFNDKILKIKDILAELNKG